MSVNISSPSIIAGIKCYNTNDIWDDAEGGGKGDHSTSIIINWIC